MTAALLGAVSVINGQRANRDAERRLPPIVQSIATTTSNPIRLPARTCGRAELTLHDEAQLLRSSDIWPRVVNGPQPQAHYDLADCLNQPTPERGAALCERPLSAYRPERNISFAHLGATLAITGTRSDADGSHSSVDEVVVHFTVPAGVNALLDQGAACTYEVRSDITWLRQLDGRRLGLAHQDSTLVLLDITDANLSQDRADAVLRTALKRAVR